ncbi:hypothetical protein RJ55_07870 [Drechmeria coniospora]|nr:hypothetical protein RJ55_07870 [Drechmeria coniospora]
MQARDAAGRQVSLLNDDGAHYRNQQPPSLHGTNRLLPRPDASPRSSSSSPITPELLRSDSYDSQMSNDPISPLTPSTDFSFPRGAIFPVGSQSAKRPPTYMSSSRSTSFDDDSTSAAAATAEQRPGKRYPCRYRDSHGCEKTFTTSGHASRHSKIHTAEKAVQCTHAGCQKKFTRADNMKQHLETHYKDKSRSSGGARAHKAMLSDSRRNSSASSRSRSSTATNPASAGSLTSRDGPPREAHERQYPPLRPDGAAASWDVPGSTLGALNRPVVARNPSSGLDALALAVECQAAGS